MKDMKAKIRDKIVDKRYDGFNVILLINDELYFYGFSELGEAIKLSDSSNGFYIKPSNDVRDTMSFALTGNMSTNTILIQLLVKKRAIGYHFVCIDGVYYQSPIYV